MQKLRQLWRHRTSWMYRPGRRLVEYSLIVAYASVAILTVIAGFTNQAGRFYSRVVENARNVPQPELGPILKQLAMMGADFCVGVSLLVVGAVIVYWSRREKTLGSEADHVAASGPPFLL